MITWLFIAKVKMREIIKKSKNNFNIELTNLTKIMNRPIQIDLYSEDLQI